MISPILESLQVLDIPDSEYFGEKYRDIIQKFRSFDTKFAYPIDFFGIL